MEEITMKRLIVLFICITFAVLTVPSGVFAATGVWGGSNGSGHGVQVGNRYSGSEYRGHNGSGYNWGGYRRHGYSHGGICVDFGFTYWPYYSYPYYLYPEPVYYYPVPASVYYEPLEGIAPNAASDTYSPDQVEIEQTVSFGEVIAVSNATIGGSSGLTITLKMDDGRTIVVQETGESFIRGNRVMVIRAPDGTLRVRHKTFSDETVTINIPNERGGYTAVVLTRSGKGFVGPQGEFYFGHPTVEQLKILYGK